MTGVRDRAAHAGARNRRRKRTIIIYRVHTPEHITETFRDRREAETRVRALETNGHRMHPRAVYGRNDDQVVAVEYHPEPSTARTSRHSLQPRAKLTKNRLAEAGAKHFNTVGYAAANINDIITQADSTKGALYFHFPSKKALAQHLVQLWGEILLDTIARVTTTDETTHRQVAAIYRELAHRVTDDQQIRAGLIMSLEPAVDETAQVYTAWTSAVTAIVEHAGTAGDCDAPAVPARLGESLCAGFVGAVHVATALGEPDTISRRVEDLLALWPGII
jgi:AcrR family transcriptional regulator